MPVDHARKSKHAERGSRARSRQSTPSSAATLEREAGNQAIAELIASSRISGDTSPSALCHPGERVTLGSHHLAPQAVAGRTVLAQQLSHVLRRRQSSLQSNAALESEAERAERDVAEPALGSQSAGPSGGADSTGAHGSALDPHTRQAMERRLGRSLADVRVFANSEAAAFARALDAHAFTIGNNVVFDDGKYAPRTRAGSALLAHELTHVAQQGNSARPAVMRKGVTARGFFANLFQSWDYSKETLEEYLNELRSTNDIVADDDSDDMARQVTEEWAADKAAYDLTPPLRVLLIREMLDGAVLGSDQEGILTLLEHSTNVELKQMIGTGPNQITYAEIEPEFGVEKERLELFNQEVLQKLEKIKVPEEGETFLEMLEKTEEETGVRLDQVTISFQIASGALFENILVDVILPGTVRVTLTITRAGLKLDFEPGLVIDIIGPVNPTLKGVRFDFKDSKARLDLDEMSDLIHDLVGPRLMKYLVGTRFADPNYDLTRDPYLWAEIKDQTVLGDLNRIKYNFLKGAEKETPEETKEKEKENEKKLGMVSAGSVELKMTHPKGARLPADEKGWGLKIPRGTTLTLTIETEGKGSELIKKNVALKRVRIVTTGVVIVDKKQEVVEVFDFDILKRLQLKFGKVKAKADLKKLAKKYFKGDAVDTATGVMEGYDKLVDTYRSLKHWSKIDERLEDWLTGQTRSPEKSDIALDIAVGLAELGFNFVAPIVVRFFWGTIRDHTGMTDEQLSKFFGIPGPEQTTKTEGKSK